MFNYIHLIWIWIVYVPSVNTEGSITTLRWRKFQILSTEYTHGRFQFSHMRSAVQCSAECSANPQYELWGFDETKKYCRLFDVRSLDSTSLQASVEPANMEINYYEVPCPIYPFATYVRATDQCFSHWNIDSYDNAEATCGYVGGHLPYVRTLAELNLLKSISELGNVTFWVGASTDGDGLWYWSDGGVVSLTGPEGFWLPDTPGLTGLTVRMCAYAAIEGDSYGLASGECNEMHDTLCVLIYFIMISSQMLLALCVAFVIGKENNRFVYQVWHSVFGKNTIVFLYKV